MSKLHQEKWMDCCEKIVMALLCVLMADCAFFGAGRTIAVGPLGFRMMLVGLVMVAGLPVMVRHFKKLVSSGILWIFAAFAMWLVLQTVRGILRGNHFGILLSDLKGFCYLVVMLPAICVLNSKTRIHSLMKVMLWTCAALGLATLFATCLYKWDHDLLMKIYGLDPDKFILNISVIIQRKVPRLFFKSVNYLLAGCAFSVYFFVTEKGKYRWIYPALTGFFLFALLMSYTRAVYLAACIAAVMLVLVFQIYGDRESRIRLWKHLVAATLVFAVITGGLGAIMGTNYVEHGLRRVVATFGATEEAIASVPEAVPQMVNAGAPQVVRLSNVVPAVEAPKKENNYAEAMTHASDAIREMTLREMTSYIRSAPVLGHGLGKAITCRQDGMSEYFYHDLLVKTGVIGLILYLLPVLWMLIGLIKKGFRKTDKLMLGSWLAVLLGFMGFSYYNPYMNASLGILFYCCILGIFVNLKYKRNF